MFEHRALSFLCFEQHACSMFRATRLTAKQIEEFEPLSSLTLPLPRLQRPRVSIVICNYNYGQFLDAAIRSAFEQSYQCEVIVVDDGSTDESRGLLEQWKNQVAVVLQPNQGQRAAYNTGFSKSEGDVVVFLDSDDQLEPHAIEKVVDAFGAGVAKVHFRLALMDREGELMGPHIPAALGQGEVFEALLRHRVLYGSAPGSGNAYRRSVLEQLFPLPVSAVDKVAADFFTIFGSAAFGNVEAIRECLGRYRIHESAKQSAEAEDFGNAIQGQDINLLFARVYQEFHSWMKERTKGKVVPPTQLRDFSRLKARYARTVFTSKRYPLFSSATGELPELLGALWYRNDYTLLQKVAATGWSLALLVCPPGLLRPLTRYLTNPASRQRRSVRAT